MIGYDQFGLQRVSVIDLTPDGAEGSIWGSGAGPAADTGANICFLANGSFERLTSNMAIMPPPMARSAPPDC